MKTPSFSGKVAAITGASSGMGRALAVALARRGCQVAISDIDEAGLAQTAALAQGARVTTHRVDVADAKALQSWAEEVARAHGRVNLIFNNAGISYGATASSGDDADVQRVININFWGVVNGTRAFLPHLEASGDGHVINTSSIFGLIAFPGQSSYNASKFAVRGFTEALRIELEMTGSPVSATCVHPGGIQTNIARASKFHPSLATLGVADAERARADVERRFRTSAEDAVEIILRGVQRNARRVLVGLDAQLVDLIQRLVPGRYHGLIARHGRRLLSTD